MISPDISAALKMPGGVYVGADECQQIRTVAQETGKGDPAASRRRIRCMPPDRGKVAARVESTL
jgi:hypothetical protein